MRQEMAKVLGVAVILTSVLGPVSAGGAASVSITLEKTVSTDSSTCPGIDPLTVTPGTQVTYCYTVSNNSSITFTTHTLNDSVLGMIPVTPPCTLAPWADNGCVVTATAVITVDTMNVATWVASFYSTKATDTDSAKVLVRNPPIITGGNTSNAPTVTGHGDPTCVGGEVLIFDCGFPPNCHHCTMLAGCPDPLVGKGTKDANGDFNIPKILFPGPGHEIYATDGCADPGLVGRDVLILAPTTVPALSPRVLVLLSVLLGVVGVIGLRRLRLNA